MIAILGILAAAALPRFVDLGRDARAAKLAAARGSVASAAQLANAAARIRGLGASDPVAMAGTTITMQDYYPTADLAGIVSAAGLAADYQFSAGGPADPPGTLVVSVVGAGDSEFCRFRYAGPFVPGDAPWISDLVVSGC